MSKKLYSLFAVLLVAAMLLTACQQPAAETPAAEEPAATEAPVATEAPAAGADVKVCQVTDTGGIDDKSFNATAWRGVENAMADFGVEGKYLESQQQTDYDKNINAFIEEGCDLVITVGFLLGDATKAAAEANPDQKFAIVDYGYDPAIPNVVPMVYATDQAGFMAGYVAAGVSKTGKVGTFGGIQIPTVTAFMDGYALGVAYYNEKHGTNVEVLGWDPATQTGLFTGNFESTDDGRTLGNTLMDEGADVIMPVAGPVGLGTAAAVLERGDAWIVGVDDDWAAKNEQYKDIVLTSVLKRMDTSVYDLTKALIEGNYKGGEATVGLLANDGVGLAPLAGVVSDELEAELEQVKADIIAGTIKTTP